MRADAPCPGSVSGLSGQFLDMSRKCPLFLVMSRKCPRTLFGDRSGTHFGDRSVTLFGASIAFHGMWGAIGSPCGRITTTSHAHWRPRSLVWRGGLCSLGLPMRALSRKARALREALIITVLHSNSLYKLVIKSFKVLWEALTLNFQHRKLAAAWCFVEAAHCS